MIMSAGFRGPRTFLDGLAQRDMLAVVDEERVLLIVCDDVLNGGESQHAHHILAIGGGVNVEVLAAARVSGVEEEGEKKGF